MGNLGRRRTTSACPPCRMSEEKLQQGQLSSFKHAPSRGLIDFSRVLTSSGRKIQYREPTKQQASFKLPRFPTGRMKPVNKSRFSRLCEGYGEVDK